MNTEKIFKNPETYEILRDGNSGRMKSLLEEMRTAYKEDNETLAEMLTAAKQDSTPLSAIVPDFQRRLVVARAIVETFAETCTILERAMDLRSALLLEMVAIGGRTYGYMHEDVPSLEQAERMIDPAVFNEIFMSKLSAHTRQYARVNPTTGRVEISYPTVDTSDRDAP